MYHDIRELYWWPGLKRLKQSISILQDCSSHAKIYIVEIMRLHGVQTSITFDRDPRFISRFWKRLQEALGLKFKFIMKYHPQTDG
ncbi:Polynucleotidyl transferase, Ribonuclease H fold [Gossypium australe]|uniref:Polynucleotidyl transferase, Ribonuclease H fold n=1 Tax=Gossypium australe TaxID=47621 RepID=A0A5B6VA85_9ROSI|nr:Polynucleotidyl transferase, Ribonuclease H fold [Gossypium australe]